MQHLLICALNLTNDIYLTTVTDPCEIFGRSFTPKCETEQLSRNYFSKYVNEQFL